MDADRRSGRAGAGEDLVEGDGGATRSAQSPDGTRSSWECSGRGSWRSRAGDRPRFALEGYAFFVEAIFLGLYLTDDGRLSPRAPGGAGSRWRSAVSRQGCSCCRPTRGCRIRSGTSQALAALRQSSIRRRRSSTRRGRSMALHSTLSTYQSVGFAAGGRASWAILESAVIPIATDYHRLGLATAMTLAVASAILRRSPAAPGQTRPSPAAGEARGDGGHSPPNAARRCASRASRSGSEAHAMTRSRCPVASAFSRPWIRLPRSSVSIGSPRTSGRTWLSRTWRSR